MRMAREVGLFIAIVFLGVLVAGDQPTSSAAKAKTGSSTTACGRYQLFQGMWGLSGPQGTLMEEHCLLRIDTETGHTWIYFKEGMSTPNPKEGWIDVLEWQRNNPTEAPSQSPKRPVP